MPIMATSFIQMAYSLTDMAWVGRLGSESVAAVGAVGILTWMSGSIALLNKVGAKVSVGQSIGARNEEDARSFASRLSFIVPLKKKYTRRIFKLGLPVATLNTLFAFVNMFLSRTASEQGGHIGLMAFTTGGQIEAITWNTSQGFSTGLSTFIAQNYAAGQKSRVKQAWRTTLWMTGVFGSLCSLLFILFGNEVFSIFVPESDAYRVGGDYLRIDGYSQMFMMMEITMQGVFYGLGRTIPPAIVSIGCNYMRIPLKKQPH